MSATLERQNNFIIYTDGGARGNPGPAAIGFVIYKIGHDGSMNEVMRRGEVIGETTNNQAEYRAVIHALETVLTFQPERVELRLDSELVGKQLTGEYRVKDRLLQPQFVRVKHLEQMIPSIQYSIIRRELNKEADREVNTALDRN